LTTLKEELAMTAIVERPVTERALAALRRAGNPFRNYFARNPDDETCSRYHVPELFAGERERLLAIVDLYRYDPDTHSEVIPVLGNKGSGKTHLLHSIKHGDSGPGQLLVTPGIYQKDSEFLEYLLFQTVDTLLGGGRQRGMRPLEFVGDELTRRILGKAIAELPAVEKSRLAPITGMSRWARVFGLGGLSGEERINDLLATLNNTTAGRTGAMRVQRLLTDAGIELPRAYEIALAYIQRTELHNTAGLMRKAIFQGFCKATLLGDESELALFLTHGFAELPFNVRPNRQELVLALFKVLMEIFRGLKLPVVVAFDQLEDLLLARRSDDGHKIAESFFAGIVQAMHQFEGLCFLVFAERGLWNRFVPSLDGYIQDRLNNPVHVPPHGTIHTLRLEAPPLELVEQVVEARLRPSLMEVPNAAGLAPIFPFTNEQVARIAKTEPTLRDMLIQFRHLFDKIVFDREEAPAPVQQPQDELAPLIERITQARPTEPVAMTDDGDELVVKSIAVVPVPMVEMGAEQRELPPPLPKSMLTPAAMLELWDQEGRTARRKLEPEGALPAAARELQAGLGALLQYCHENGVKVGPWRLQHVVAEWTFGDHPTYGALSLAHWACKDGQPWKVGIGLFLARGGGKPKDLEIKLTAFDVEPPMLDHLILLRPDDDMSLTGKSKAMWTEAERKGRHARLEPLDLDAFATLASFPRWLAALRDSLPDGQPLPNLADLIQERCEKLLEQVCMPIQ
jgi:hypothetical protein